MPVLVARLVKLQAAGVCHWGIRTSLARGGLVGWEGHGPTAALPERPLRRDGAVDGSVW